MKELCQANMLYKEKISHEKRDARAREKEEVDRLEADKGQGSCSCKAERESTKGKLSTIRKLSASRLQERARLYKKQHKGRSRDIGSAPARRVH
jgi:hypothetical protein